MRVRNPKRRCLSAMMVVMKVVLGPLHHLSHVAIGGITMSVRAMGASPAAHLEVQHEVADVMTTVADMVGNMMVGAMIVVAISVMTDTGIGVTTTSSMTHSVISAIVLTPGLSIATLHARSAIVGDM